jgi:hypothetical protein
MGADVVSRGMPLAYADMMARLLHGAARGARRGRQTRIPAADSEKATNPLEGAGGIPNTAELT